MANGGAGSVYYASSHHYFRQQGTRRIVHISHYDQVRSHVAVPTNKFLRKLRLSDFAADMGRSHQSEVISDEPDLSVPNEQKFHLMVHLFENDNL